MTWLGELAVKLFGPLAKGTVWFFVAIVIPLTTWLIAIRFDANANAAATVKLEARTATIEAKLEARDLRDAERAKMLADQYSEIQRALGRIEGRLRADH